MDISSAIHIIIFVVIMVFLSRIKVRQYERGVKFTLGKFNQLLEPGRHFRIPIFQKITIIDIRPKTVNIPNIDIFTKDNISVNLSVLIEYKVLNIKKAVLKVANFSSALIQLTQTITKNTISEINLDQLSRDQYKTTIKIKDLIEKNTNEWGVKIKKIELNLPSGIKKI